MRKDLKIGMIIGVVLVTAATLAISFWPEASIEARQKKTFKEKKVPLPETTVPPGIDDTDESAESGDIKTVKVNNNINEPDENSAPASEDKNSEGVKIHIVAEGETLRDIAEKYYGNRLMINRIVDSNPDVITDINKLEPGMKLEIELH